MNQTRSALVELKDIHLPAPEAWWVLAPGWWLLMGLAVLLILLLWKYQVQLKAFIQSRQSKKEMQAAVFSELDMMRKEYADNGNAHALLQSLSIYLRRVTLNVFEQQQAVGKIEDVWLNFLDAQWVQTKPENSFTTAQMAALLNVAVYKPTLTEQEAEQVKSLLELTDDWVKQVVKHHV